MTGQVDLSKLAEAAALMEEMRIRAIGIVQVIGDRGIGDACYGNPHPESSRLEINNSNAVLHWFLGREGEGSDDMSHSIQSFPIEFLLIEPGELNGSLSAFIDQEIERRNARDMAEKLRQAELEESGRRNFMEAMPGLVKDLMEQQKSARAIYDATQSQILELFKELAMRGESSQ